MTGVLGGRYAQDRIAKDLVRARDLARSFRRVIREPDGFEQRIDRSAGDWACWPWTGSRTAAGYGVGAPHRIAYCRATGFWAPLRSPWVIRHLCHNPPCCNERHLLVGSRGDNAWDDLMRQRGVDLVAVREAIETRGPFLPVTGIAA